MLYVNSDENCQLCYFMKIIILKVAVSYVTISHFTYTLRPLQYRFHRTKQVWISKLLTKG